MYPKVNTHCEVTFACGTSHILSGLPVRIFDCAYAIQSFYWKLS